MAKIAESRLSPQGQISIPAEVRRRLRLEPGGTIEWNALDSGEIIVRPAQRPSFQEIRARFAHLRPVRTVTVEEMDAGVSKHIRMKHSLRRRRAGR